MGNVSTGFSMSLDGFVAGPNHEIEHVFAWMNAGDLDYVTTIGDRNSKLKISAESIKMFEDAIESAGVLIAGRRLFEMTHGWGGRHPLNVPIVVVSHNPAPEWVQPEWPFTFISEGVEKAIEQAQKIAGEKKVVIASTTIAQQAINLGLLDEIHIDLVPVIMGEGIRLFDHLKQIPVKLESPDIQIGKGVTHLTYKVKKEAQSAS